MASYMLALSIGSAVTVSIISALGVYVIATKMSLDDLTLNKSFGKRTIVTSNKYEWVAFVFFFFAFNWAIFLMIRRYPLRIYRNGDQYVAIFEGHIPFLRRQVPFAKGQVEPMPARGILPWKDSRYSLNGTRTILLEYYFKTPSELHRMINEKYKYY